MDRSVPFVSLLVAGHLVLGSVSSAATAPQKPMVVRSVSTTLAVSPRIQSSTGRSLSKAEMEAIMAGAGLSSSSTGASISMGSPGPAGEEDEDAVKPIDPQFMQLFQQVKLDRRPSTILTEWAKPEPLPSDEDPELKDPEDPEAIADEPAALTAPTKPERPADLVEPIKPEDVVQDVDGIAGLISLAAKKQEVADGYADKLAVYTEALTAFEAKEAEYETAQAEYETAKEAFDEEKKTWDKAKKAFDKEKAKVDQKKAMLKMKRIQRDIEIFSRNVTLGRWEAVAETLALFDKQAKMQYEQMLGKISRTPQPMNGQLARFQELPAFEFDDIISLIGIAPQGPDPEDPDKMGPEGFDPKKAMLIAPLVRRVFAQGHSLDDWVERLREETSRPEEERVATCGTASWGAGLLQRGRRVPADEGRGYRRRRSRGAQPPGEAPHGGSPRGAAPGHAERCLGRDHGDAGSGRDRGHHQVRRAQARGRPGQGSA